MLQKIWKLFSRRALSWPKDDPAVRDTSYDVYVFYDYDARPYGQDWMKKYSSPSFGSALKRAKVLHRRGVYRRVEIHKKYFDGFRDRRVDYALKIYERKRVGVRRFCTCSSFFFWACSLMLVLCAAGVALLFVPKI